MKYETGNLNSLLEENPERKGWIVGSFIPPESLMHSKTCEVKWVYHIKGLKKSAGKELETPDRTLVILISGKWLTRFIECGEEMILANPGDYLIYEGAQHENEALEDSHVMVIRWKNNA